MARNNEIPEVNAGSMADIAFLLLIFFLVTTTIQTDVGIDRKLPPQETTPPLPINERNIFRVSLNKNDELFVEGDVLSIDQLKTSAITFLDNGGSSKEDANHCNYCKGEHRVDSSDNPQEAIIAFNSDREASYGMYIRVQNELTAAYTALRNREAQRMFNMDFVDMEEIYFDVKTSVQTKKKLKTEISQIRNMYPMKLSEAETKFNL
ncbi:biopolymer transporter ExbD [Flagellimonas sp. S3867]|uniref:ExbD/TolR family protein n=1 Tax=Flagellimonas sp. S3867 TaxID=2768063 RepID=UPI001687CED3|nr:biopolymer transporter ExbD [Flagellimonas sp. S3867]